MDKFLFATVMTMKEFYNFASRDQGHLWAVFSVEFLPDKDFISVFLLLTHLSNGKGGKKEILTC